MLLSNHNPSNLPSPHPLHSLDQVEEVSAVWELILISHLPSLSPVDQLTRVEPGLFPAVYRVTLLRQLTFTLLDCDQPHTAIINQVLSPDRLYRGNIKVLINSDSLLRWYPIIIVSLVCEHTSLIRVLLLLRLHLHSSAHLLTLTLLLLFDPCKFVINMLERTLQESF